VRLESNQERKKQKKSTESIEKYEKHLNHDSEHKREARTHSKQIHKEIEQRNRSHINE